jgi:hypothetical protein
LLIEVLAVGGGVEVNTFPFDPAPEAFEEGVVGGPAPSVAADLAASGQQRLLEGLASESAALVRVRDGRGRLGGQRGVQGCEAKNHGERVGELPAEHVARVPVEGGHQVEEAPGHGHVGDVRASTSLGAVRARSRNRYG